MIFSEKLCEIGIRHTMPDFLSQRTNESWHSGWESCTCHGRHLPSERFKSQRRRVSLQGRPQRKLRVVDQHVKFRAAARVTAHRVVLVEVYLAGVHHFSAWERRRLTQTLWYCTGAKGCWFATILILSQTWGREYGIKDDNNRYCLGVLTHGYSSEQE